MVKALWIGIAENQNYTCTSFEFFMILQKK